MSTSDSPDDRIFDGAIPARERATWLRAYIEARVQTRHYNGGIDNRDTPWDPGSLARGRTAPWGEPAPAGAVLLAVYHNGNNAGYYWLPAGAVAALDPRVAAATRGQSAEIERAAIGYAGGYEALALRLAAPPEPDLFVVRQQPQDAPGTAGYGLAVTRARHLAGPHLRAVHGRGTPVVHYVFAARNRAKDLAFHLGHAPITAIGPGRAAPDLDAYLAGWER